MTAATLEMAEQELTTNAIGLQKQINELTEQLGNIKADLRGLANGSTKEIIVDGIGKIHISAPFAGSETPILVLDEGQLEKEPELKSQLIAKDIIKSDIKRVAASVAKVTIKPNV